MNTDKEIYLILTRCPEFISTLSGLPSHGKSQVKSVNIKAIDRTADSVEFPVDPKAPIRAIEVQFQRRARKGNVYRRLITSMALIQEENPDRGIEGIVFFANTSCDPKTAPWHGSGLIHEVYLEDELKKLKKKSPGHPLIAVFAPVFEEDTEALVNSAKQHYDRIQKSKSLSHTQRRVLSEVFEHWFLERLPTYSRKEIAMILDLPDIRQTVCGKELLDEGREEGIEKGAADILLTLLGSRFKVPGTVEKQIRALKKPQLEELALALTEIDKLKDLRAWLADVDS